MCSIDGVGALLDDIYVKGKNEKEHNDKLINVLQLLNNYGLKVKVEKCSFAKESIEYLGHHIDRVGLHPTDKHVKSIWRAKSPDSARMPK